MTGIYLNNKPLGLKLYDDLETNEWYTCWTCDRCGKQIPLTTNADFIITSDSDPFICKDCKP